MTWLTKIKTDADTRMIRKMYEYKFSVTDIALKFNVTKVTIYRKLKGR